MKDCIEYDIGQEAFSVKPLADICFFLLINTFWFNRVFHIGINLYLSDLFVIGIFALTLIQMMDENRILFFRYFGILFAAIFLYYVFLVFYSYAVLGSPINRVLGRFRMLMAYPLLLFSGFVFTRQREDFKRYMKIIETYISISVMIGLAGIAYPSLSKGTVFVTNDDGEAVSSALYFMVVGHGTALLGCLVIIYELLNLLRTQKAHPSSLFFLTVGLIGVIGSQNRSIYLTFLASLLLIVWVCRKAEKRIKNRMRIAIIILCFFVGGVVIVTVRSPIFKLFETRWQETAQIFDSDQEFFDTIPGIRVGRTIATFREWLKAPILGCGWGRQLTEYDIYNFAGEYVRTNYGTPHNYYMTLLYQTGIIGFLIMLLTYYRIYIFIKPKRLLDSETGDLYSLYIFYLIFLFFNIGNTHLYGHPVFIPVFFFLIGMSIAYAGLVKYE